MRVRQTTFLALALLVLLSISKMYRPQEAFAECGTYVAFVSTCSNAETGNTVDPHTVCSQNASVCCSSQTECDDIFGPPEEPPGNEPPSGYPPSDEDCGAWHSDQGLGRQICLDGSGHEVASAISCSKAPQCCKNQDLCTKYYSCLLDPQGNKTGACKEDYTAEGIYTDTPSCLTACAVNQPPSEKPPGTISLPVAPGLNIEAFLCEDGASLNIALGCVDLQSNSIYVFFLRWGISIIGGIAFLLIIVASIIIITSTGDPKRLQSGKELLGAAIAGVILLIFSVFIMRLVGFNILLIPIFG